MHIPDGFLNGTTSAGAAALAAGGLGLALRRAGRQLQDRRIPLTGLVAAFVFALQMLNFPVAAGTTGHLIGGALAVILVGPWLGITAVAVVVMVQALLFADGGVVAMGANVLNMAVITGLVGWYLFRVLLRVLPRRWPAVLVATFAAALVSVIASAGAFVVEYGLGGRGGADIRTVLLAMVGVHFFIGVGEGLISAAAVGAVAATRPELVAGTADRGLGAPGAGSMRSGSWGFVLTGVAVAALLVLVVAPFADPDPDGLQRVAIDQGFAGAAVDSPTADSPLAGYGVEGVDDEPVATRLSGLAGVGITFLAGVGILGTFAAIRARRAG